LENLEKHRFKKSMLNYRKIAWTLVNNSLEIIIGLGTIVLVTRVYTPDEVGAWSVFTALFFFITKVREGIVQTALVKYSAGLDGPQYWQTLKSSFIINLALEASLSSIVALVGLINIFPKLSQLLILYPTYALGWSIYRWSLFVFQSRLQVEQIFRMNLLMVAILSLGFGLLVMLGSPLWMMVVILASASIVAAFYGLIALDITELISANFDKGIIKELITFGKYGLLREVSGTLSSRINVFLSAGLLSLSDAGLLGIAQRFTQLILIPNAAIQTLIFPKACELTNQKKSSDLKELYESSVAMLLAMFLPMVIFIGIFAEKLILIFNGSYYQHAAPLLVVMVFTVALFSPFGNAFGSVINAIGKPGINLKVVSTNAVINITLSGALIGTIGLYGAVLAPLITEIFGFIWISILLKQELNISFQRCFKLIPKSYQNLFDAMKQKLRSEGVGV